MTQLTKGLFTDHSITSLSGSSQSLLTLDATRQAVIITNPSATYNLAFTINATAALNAGGSITLPPYGSMVLDAAIASNAIAVIGVAGQGVTCWSYP